MTVHFQDCCKPPVFYDENKNLVGSNTVIFDLTQMTDEKIKEYEEFFRTIKEKIG